MMPDEKNRCPHCGQVIDKRIINMFGGLAKALWIAYRWCQEHGTHEFEMKDIRDKLDQNQYARFGDLVMFSGLVYKQGKAHYGLNEQRCTDFFAGDYWIPLSIEKDPITGMLVPGEHGNIHKIKGLKEFLDDDGLYRALYKPRV